MIILILFSHGYNMHTHTIVKKSDKQNNLFVLLCVRSVVYQLLIMHSTQSWDKSTMIVIELGITTYIQHKCTNGQISLYCKSLTMDEPPPEPLHSKTLNFFHICTLYSHNAVFNNNAQKLKPPIFLNTNSLHFVQSLNTLVIFKDLLSWILYER